MAIIAVLSLWFDDWKHCNCNRYFGVQNIFFHLQAIPIHSMKLEIFVYTSNIVATLINYQLGDAMLNIFNTTKIKISFILVLQFISFVQDTCTHQAVNQTPRSLLSSKAAARSVILEAAVPLLSFCYCEEIDITLPTRGPSRTCNQVPPVSGPISRAREEKRGIRRGVRGESKDGD